MEQNERRINLNCNEQSTEIAMCTESENIKKRLAIGIED